MLKTNNICSSFFDLINNICEHVRTTQKAVELVCDNDRRLLLIGFKDTVSNKTWKVRLIDVQRWYGDENGFNRNNMFGPRKSKADGAIALSNYANTFLNKEEDMIKINEIYSNIRLLEDKSRGVGKTVALAKAAKSVSNGVIITNTWSVAQMIKKEYDVETCSLDKLDTLRGRDCALFYDNTAIMQLASRAVVENQKLQEENKISRGALEDIKNENKETKTNLYKINVNAVSCIKESFDEVCNELKDKDFISDDEYHNVKVTLNSFLDTYESVHYNKPRFITFKANDYNYGQINFNSAYETMNRISKEKNFSSFNKPVSEVDAVKTQGSTVAGIDMATGESCSKQINIMVDGKIIGKVSNQTLFESTGLNYENESKKLKEETKYEIYSPTWNTSELKLPIKETNIGSHCQKCNYFNEYVSEDNYVCYSCKH